MRTTLGTSLLLAAALGVSAVPARADEAADPSAASFQGFCSQWMSKLADRKLFNLKRAQPEKSGDGVVLHYDEYSAPVSCEAKRGKNGSLIGRLVYHELHMLKSGASHKGALADQPDVLSRTEVLEIFRHDGKHWKY
jgi:hypothetical protein